MKNLFIIGSLLCNLFLIAALIYVCCYKTDLSRRLKAKITGEFYMANRADDNCVTSWNTCVTQLDYKADIVFFGNSLTEGGEWQKQFPDVKIVNSGYIGDDLKGMMRRVCQIKHLQPKKIFIMAGINGLKNRTSAEFENQYSMLVDSIRAVSPQTQVYLESLLPVGRTSGFCPSDKIIKANEIIKKYADNHKLVYIDLYHLYAEDDYMPDQYTYEGVHLKPEAYSFWYDAVKPFVNFSDNIYYDKQ
ncbi:MAG: hypothetical protein IJS00_04845 [Paludibacteraceae bacterium]|nr:hypothetical protein [Paludibacteraceae bacterium]